MESTTPHRQHSAHRAARWFTAALFALTAFTQPAVAEARMTLSAGAEPERIELHTCQLECGRALAQCERERPRGTHCARTNQFCRSECAASDAPPITAALRQERLCAQRCEMSAAVCEEQTPKNRESCRSGLAQCVERCQ